VSPSYDYPHYGLGIAYNNKNDLPNAIHWFKECIRINPNYDCPYYALGNIYRLGKNYQQAVEYYQQSLKIKAVDPLCCVNIALAYIMAE
jgi:tetratricopeptide (TPR) repeat protein